MRVISIVWLALTAIALLMAAHMARYSISGAGNRGAVYLLDRWSGQVVLCFGILESAQCYRVFPAAAPPPSLSSSSPPAWERDPIVSPPTVPPPADKARSGADDLMSEKSRLGQPPKP